MTSEQMPEGNESHEDTEAVFRHEIKQALSPVFAKTIQELLPGHLPNKPQEEFTRLELEQYRIAFRIVGEMVQHDEAEVVFDSDEHAEESLSERKEDLAVMKFKLRIDKGHHVTEGGFAETSNLAFNQK